MKIQIYTNTESLFLIMLGVINMENNDYVVRVTPLKDKVHNTEEGIRISHETVEIMQDQLEQLIDALIREAIIFCKEAGRKTIMESDIKAAFDNLISPHMTIDESIEKLKECMMKLEESKSSGFGRYLGV